MTPILKQLRFSEHRHLDTAAPGPISDFLKTILLVNGIAAIVLAIFYFLAAPAHADGGGVSGAIGAVISAMSPTSTAPDSISSSDSDDD